MNLTDIETAIDDAVNAAEETTRAAVATADDGLAERILELAALPKLDYERVRRTTANELGMRVTALDAAVRAARQASGDEQIRATQRDALVCIAVSHGELWRDEAEEPYATIEVAGHREHYRVRGQQYRRWLTRAYGDENKIEGPKGEELPSAPGNQAVTEALNAIEAQAIRGPLDFPKLRIAGDVRSIVYLDLCNDDWSAIAVDASGWRPEPNPGVRFIRAPGMLPLPEPKRGEGLRRLRELLRLQDEATFTLVLGWLIGAFRPKGPYPVLAIHGEQGSGKTTLVRMLRRIIDPNRAGDRSRPKDERDLVIAASNSWLVAFDNLSRLDEDISDAMCRIATGSGFGTRTLYTNADETLFQVCRPQLVNGIPELARAGDLIDRAIMVELPRPAPEALAYEDDLWPRFEAALPEILGALLDAVSMAIGRLDTTTLHQKPRLADFARWVEAAAPALGWPQGHFLDAYLANRDAASRVAVEADTVANVVLRTIAVGESFSGTAEALLSRLNAIATEDEKRAPGWPKTAANLGTRIRRAAPALRRLGVEVAYDRTGTERTIQIDSRPKSPSSLSPPSSSRGNDARRDGHDGNDGGFVARTESPSRVHSGPVAVAEGVF